MTGDLEPDPVVLVLGVNSPPPGPDHLVGGPGRTTQDHFRTRTTLASMPECHSSVNPR